MKINASMQQLIYYFSFLSFFRAISLLPCSRGHYLIHYTI